MANSTENVEVENSNSRIWQYFLKALDGNTAKCKFMSCHENLRITGGSTQGLFTHLETKHKINLAKRTNETNESALASGSKPEAKKSKVEDIITTKKEEALEEVLAKFAAKDEIPLKVLATSEGIRKGIAARGFTNIPCLPSIVNELIVRYSLGVRGDFAKEFSQLKGEMKKFSCCFDEASIKNRRYINIILFGNNKLWNLGLTRISGRLPAEKCVEKVIERLNQFGIDLHTDVVSITTDGAAVMKKVGKLISCSQILCMAHGIQLGIVNILYKISTIGDEHGDEHGEVADTSDDKNEEQFELSDENQIGAILKKVRQTVAMFRRCPTSNDLLQKYVEEETGEEQQLIMDSKTRWSSMLEMLERFFSLRNCIKKALIDIKDGIEILDSELVVIKSIISALKPANDAMDELCKKHANLLTADATLDQMLQILQNGDNLSQKLKEKLMERIFERRTVLSDTLRYLHFGKKDPEASMFANPSQQTITKFILELVERLMPDEVKSESESENNTKRKKNALKREMDIFDDGGIKGPLLNLTYEYLLTVKPTSFESERAFSSATIFCSKLHAPLNDDSLDHLVFLKAFFAK